VAITQKVFTSRSNNLDSATYVGEVGRLFYEQPGVVGVAPVLKYSDGSTPGGLPLSGSSLTFSGSTPPDNPHDGLLWWDSIDGRLYIYYEGTWVDASPYPITSSTGITLTSVSVSGNIRYDQTQNNGTATQITSKSTSVTCNGRTGQITTHNAQLAKGASVKFTVVNSSITSAKDVIITNIASGATIPYSVTVNNISSTGTFDISLGNLDSTPSGANASDTLVINFAVIKVS
jgi:hypothetical protein